MYLSEPSSLMNRKKLLFSRANPRNLKRVRVPLTKSLRVRSNKNSESEQVSGSSHTNSPPHAASPDMHKRKRNPDEEDSGASKLSQPAAKETSPEGQENFNPFTCAGSVSS
jgi:hypothetical protein